MPTKVAKKTTAKKVAAPAKKSASRAGAGARATSTSSKGGTTTKKTASKKAASTSGKKSTAGTTSKKGSGKSTQKKSNLPVREVNEETGFVKGSDQDKIASAFLKGGETRQEIIDRLRKNLDSTTRNGTEKPVSNLVSSVYNKMIRAGFRLESSYKLLPPTPASKRKAARAK